MKNFRFLTTLKCHLANGDTTTLRNVEVIVEGIDQHEAKRHISAVATETVHDRGDTLLDAPLDCLQVVECRAA